MIRIILIGLSLIIAAGCASAPAKTSASKSSITAVDRYREIDWLRAEGTGQTESEAVNQAKAELGRIFESRVRSQTVDRMKSASTETGDERFEQDIEAMVLVESDIHLKGIEVAWVKREDAGKYRALAVLEKEKAKTQWLRELSDVDETIAGHFKRMETAEGTLMKYRAMRDATRQWVRHEVLASRLNIIDAIIPSPAYDMSALFRQLPQVKEQLVVIFDLPGDDTGVLRSRIADALTERGYLITEDDDPATVLIQGMLEVSPLKMDDPQWKYVRVKIALSVIDYESGLSIGEVNIDRRSAHLTKDEAARKGVTRVASDVAAQVVDILEQ